MMKSHSKRNYTMCNGLTTAQKDKIYGELKKFIATADPVKDKDAIAAAKEQLERMRKERYGA